LSSEPQRTGGVLVHCEKGVSRSSCVGK
jgi:protein-tyrosine phosphatase